MKCLIEPLCFTSEAERLAKLRALVQQPDMIASSHGRTFLAGLLGLAGLASCANPALSEPAPVCRAKVVQTFPHDPSAFTEGLFYADGLLWESTGMKGQSRVFSRKLDDITPVQQGIVDPTFFGEGIVAVGDEIISLTWRDGMGYRWDRKTMTAKSLFPFSGEGWGMTAHGGTIWQSDGSANLRLRDPATFDQTGALLVTDEGKPVDQLNELEWIDGEIWANIWMKERIARIDPETGHVKGWIDLRGLGQQAGARTADDVANGIAWDETGKRIFVTGKNWSKLYEIEPDCPAVP